MYPHDRDNRREDSREDPARQPLPHRPHLSQKPAERREDQRKTR